MTCSGSQDPRLLQALASMKAALVLLDDADASPDVGAHLDLAICRLETSMELEPSSAEPVPTITISAQSC